RRRPVISKVPLRARDHLGAALSYFQVRAASIRRTPSSCEFKPAERRTSNFAPVDTENSIRGDTDEAIDLGHPLEGLLYAYASTKGLFCGESNFRYPQDSITSIHGHDFRYT